MAWLDLLAVQVQCLLFLRKRAGERAAEFPGPAHLQTPQQRRSSERPQPLQCQRGVSSEWHSQLCTGYTEDFPHEGAPPSPPAGIQPQPGAGTQATLLRDVRSRAPRLWSFLDSERAANHRREFSGLQNTPVAPGGMGSLLPPSGEAESKAQAAWHLPGTADTAVDPHHTAAHLHVQAPDSLRGREG